VPRRSARSVTWHAGQHLALVIVVVMGLELKGKSRPPACTHLGAGFTAISHALIPLLNEVSI